MTHRGAGTGRAAITASIVSLRDDDDRQRSTASASAAGERGAAAEQDAQQVVERGDASVPPSASGSSSATPSNPSSLVEATWSHRSTGGLSIATRRPGSNAPTRNACHDVPMLRTAAS